MVLIVPQQLSRLNGGTSEEDFDTARAEAAANATTVDNGSGMVEATPQPTDKTTKGAGAWAFEATAVATRQREECFKELQDLEQRANTTTKRLFGDRT